MLELAKYNEKWYHIAMEHSSNGPSDFDKNLDEFINSILDKEVTEKMALEEDVNFQEYVAFEKQTRMTIAAYCAEKDLLSQDLTDKILQNDIQGLYGTIENDDKPRLYLFDQISSTYMYLEACNQNNDTVSYEEENELVRDLIGYIARVYATDEERTLWFNSVRDIILPCAKQISTSEFNLAIEQAEMLQDIQQLKDYESAFMRRVHHDARDLTKVYLELSYGAHDDIPDVANAIVAVARFRYLDFPMDMYEDKLREYTGRYPLVEQCVEATIRYLHARLDT